MSYNTGSQFNAQRWYDALMDKRTREALRLRAEEYEREHGDDSDEMLLNAIRERAAELGYVPYAVDCLAGDLIVRRFGSWTGAVKLADLPHPRGPIRLRDSRLYQEEYRRQQKIRRTEKAEKAAERRSSAAQRDARKAAASPPEKEDPGEP